MKYREKEQARAMQLKGRPIGQIAAAFSNRFTPDEISAGIDDYSKQRKQQKENYQRHGTRPSPGRLTARRLGLISREADLVEPTDAALAERERRLLMFGARPEAAKLCGDPPLALSAFAQRPQVKPRSAFTITAPPIVPMDYALTRELAKHIERALWSRRSQKATQEAHEHAAN